MKANVTINHDWLRVVATENKQRKLSLTVSRRGETCSGKGIDEPLTRSALTSFGRWLQHKTEGNYEGKIRKLESLAAESETLDQYVGKIAGLVS